MHVARGLDHLPRSDAPVFVVVGVFDGLHLGHAYLLDHLVAEAARIGAKFLLDPPRPPHWGGYLLVPDTFEFWQGRPNRMHDRFLYTRQADKVWTIERLAP